MSSPSYQQNSINRMNKLTNNLSNDYDFTRQSLSESQKQLPEIAKFKQLEKEEEGDNFDKYEIQKFIASGSEQTKKSDNFITQGATARHVNSHVLDHFVKHLYKKNANKQPTITNNTSNSKVTTSCKYPQSSQNISVPNKKGFKMSLKRVVTSEVKIDMKVKVSESEINPLQLQKNISGKDSIVLSNFDNERKFSSKVIFQPEDYSPDPSPYRRSPQQYPMGLTLSPKIDSPRSPPKSVKILDSSFDQCDDEHCRDIRTSSGIKVNPLKLSSECCLSDIEEDSPVGKRPKSFTKPIMPQSLNRLVLPISDLSPSRTRGVSNTCLQQCNENVCSSPIANKLSELGSEMSESPDRLRDISQLPLFPSSPSKFSSKNKLHLFDKGEDDITLNREKKATSFVFKPAGPGGETTSPTKAQSMFAISVGKGHKHLHMRLGARSFKQAISQAQLMKLKQSKNFNPKNKSLSKLEKKYCLEQRRFYKKDLQAHIDNELQKIWSNWTYFQNLFDNIQNLQITDMIKLRQAQFYMELDENLINPEDFDCIQEWVHVPPIDLYHDPQHIKMDILDSASFLQNQMLKFKIEYEKSHKYFHQQKDKIYAKFLSVCSTSITDHEMNIILDQYEKPADERNYQFLIDIISKLNFFKKYSYTTRHELLKLANLKSYEANNYIFHQGDIGDQMYCIIRGACNVRINKEDSEGVVSDPIVVTLYDGQSFGELALLATKQYKGMGGVLKRCIDKKGKLRFKDVINEFRKEEQMSEEQKKSKDKKSPSRHKVHKQVHRPSVFQTLLEQVQQMEGSEKVKKKKDQNEGRRAASIQTSEKTHLFTIEKHLYNGVILALIQQDHSEKLELLQYLPFFEYADTLSLIPLTDMIEVRSYRLEDILLPQGANPDHFFIISKGRVKLVKQEIVVREKKTIEKVSKNNFLQPQDQKETEFDHLIKSYDKQTIRHKEEERLMEEIHAQDDKPQSQHYSMRYQDGNSVAYTYEYQVGTLTRGNVFMERAFLREYKKMNPNAFTDSKRNFDEKSRVSVIADSAFVEVYVFNRLQVYQIHGSILSQIIDGIMTQKDFDCGYTELKHQEVKTWDDHKIGVLTTNQREREMEKLRMNPKFR